MTSLDTSGKVIQGWDPETPENWDKKIAWQTLIITTAILFLAFATWYLVSAITPMLNRIGFHFSKGQLYWIASISGLSGGLFRLIFMFLPPIVGTRKLVSISSFLFVIPMLGWFMAVQDTSTPFWWFMVLSFIGGIGGGVFSGFMPSTGYFFPKRMAGTALGIQAGIGNFGVSFIQLVAPMIMGVSLLGLGAFAPQKTSEGLVWVHSVAAVLIPWAIVLGIVGWIMLKDVPIKANFRQQIDIFGNKNTWILTIIYLMTFGAFSGFAAQLALLINNTFGVDSPFKDEYINLPRGAAYAFLGPLISALVRAAWGPLCDKFGGAIWTFISGVGMTVFTAIAALFLKPSDPNEFNWFLAAMLIMFFFTGIGNAGTFKQMPMILPRRQAGGVIGWTSAIAAFGPFIVGVLLSAMAPTTFFWGCVVFFAFATALTWIYYARPGAPFPG